MSPLSSRTNAASAFVPTLRGPATLLSSPQRHFSSEGVARSTLRILLFAWSHRFSHRNAELRLSVATGQSWNTGLLGCMGDVCVPQAPGVHGRCVCVCRRLLGCMGDVCVCVPQAPGVHGRCVCAAGSWGAWAMCVCVPEMGCISVFLCCFLPYFFEAGCLLEPGAQKSSWTGWLMSPTDEPHTPFTFPQHWGHTCPPTAPVSGTAGIQPQGKHLTD